MENQHLPGQWTYETIQTEALAFPRFIAPWNLETCPDLGKGAPWMGSVKDLEKTLQGAPPAITGPPTAGDGGRLVRERRPQGQRGSSCRASRGSWPC